MDQSKIVSALFRFSPMPCVYLDHQFSLITQFSQGIFLTFYTFTFSLSFSLSPLHLKKYGAHSNLDTETSRCQIPFIHSIISLIFLFECFPKFFSPPNECFSTVIRYNFHFISCFVWNILGLTTLYFQYDQHTHTHTQTLPQDSNNKNKTKKNA